jgi:hypothetical protein
MPLFPLLSASGGEVEFAKGKLQSQNPAGGRILAPFPFAFFSGTFERMAYTLVKLELLAPLFYTEDRSLEPFRPPAGGEETLFCFGIDGLEGRSIEPAPSAFPGTPLFGGRAVPDAGETPGGGPPPVREGCVTLPKGSYLFVQTEGVLDRRRFAETAVEMQKDGLWERLEPENRIYLRYLFEDGRTASQIFRPYRRAASTM